MKTHHLKIWTKWFMAVVDGRVAFQIRRDDRGFEVGDLLVLEEYRHAVGEYTGRKVERRITYIARSNAGTAGLDVEMIGILPGYCVLALVAP